MKGLRIHSIWALLFMLTISPSLWAQGGPGESSFVDENGVTTLTDRPEYYRAVGGYLEVELDIQPITIVESYAFTRTGRIETNSDFRALIRHYANQYKLDKYLVQAVIKAESNFDPYAVSRAGAQGLMQLMPGTAAEMSIRDPFDPGQNIAGGTQYLFKLLKLYNNDLDLALAAYNAGPGNVRKYKGVPPFKETRNYIKKVKRYMLEYSGGKSSMLVNRSTKRSQKTFTPTADHPFVVHFKNGTTQPVREVTEKGDFYILKYDTREDFVRKKLVTRIEPLA